MYCLLFAWDDGLTGNYSLDNTSSIVLRNTASGNRRRRTLGDPHAQPEKIVDWVIVLDEKKLIRLVFSLLKWRWKQRALSPAAGNGLEMRKGSKVWRML